jgi:hypothetical protein
MGSAENTEPMNIYVGVAGVENERSQCEEVTVSKGRDQGEK